MPLPLLALAAAIPTRVKLAIGVGLVAAIASGVLYWRHTRQVNALRDEIVTLTQQRDAEHVRAVEFEGALRSMTANRDLMASRVADQNRQIEQLQVTRKLVEQTASLAAVRVIESGKATITELRAPTTAIKPGHEAMNQFTEMLEGAK